MRVYDGWREKTSMDIGIQGDTGSVKTFWTYGERVTWNGE